MFYCRNKIVYYSIKNVVYVFLYSIMIYLVIRVGKFIYLFFGWIVWFLFFCFDFVCGYYES